MPNTYNAALDTFSGYARGPESVGLDAAAVTPSDAANLALYGKAMRVYVPATLTSAQVRVTPVHAADDANTVTLTYVSGVHYEPLAVRRIWSTGTTAGIELHVYTV